MAAAAPKLVLSLRLKNILFATDFSACSETAVPYLQSIASRFGSTVHVLHVLPPEAHLEVPLDPLPAKLDKERQVAEQLMARFLVRNPLKGVSHEVLVERGPLWHVIESVLREKQVDLIVVGTHGRRGLKKLVLGSVAEEIFRRARCPVLTIGPHIEKNGLAEGQIRSLVYATDFSAGSMQALPYALGLARENQARLTLVHVLHKLPETATADADQLVEACRERLLQLVPPAAQAACAAEATVLAGNPADGILREAAARHAQLIVMGARRAPPTTAAHLPWATAHRVVCDGPCPVLTVRS
jgi:nucleotide-binding universal stress UspA family protein